MSHKLTDGGQVLHVGTLARVEGEGAMHIEIKDGRVEQVQLRIFEPPRFYEAFLRGRAWTEPPDITARICGICPVAYQFSSCLAIEDACGVVVPDAMALKKTLLPTFTVWSVGDCATTGAAGDESGVPLRMVLLPLSTT